MDPETENMLKGKLSPKELSEIITSINEIQKRMPH